MATEKGVVVEVGDDTAWVKTEKSGACESCCARGACLPIGGGNDMKVEAINIAGAATGDRVAFSFGSSSLLKATFLLYMFPILCLISGAIAGMILAPLFSVDEQALSVIIGFSCFLGSVFIVRAKGNKMSQKDEYKPKIIRILRRQ
ncbi:MAG: SoxR reducing system RseC family protein [Deltaproteobacteria bacterium]|nr:SoxR reducing system RseC family protein [Deltaproteobacteria bacterium]